MQRLLHKKSEKSSLTNFTVRSSEARITPAFVSQIRLHLTGAIITRIHHTWSDFTARAIESWRAKTASVSSLVYTCPAIVATLLRTVVYGTLTVTTYS